MTLRAVHAAVRIQFVRVSRACTAASNPASSRRCAGTCQSQVLIQMMTARIRPIQASGPHIGGPSVVRPYAASMRDNTSIGGTPPCGGVAAASSPKNASKPVPGVTTSNNCAG